MPKDTKSSGNNKAPACESRGFGHKKEGENFDTPSYRFLEGYSSVSSIFDDIFPIASLSFSSGGIMLKLPQNFSS